MAQSINYTKIKTDSTSSFTAVGTILPWTKLIPPTGYLKCDGSAISRTTYADLFQVIGTAYGSGDGSTTFNLPDLTSRNPVGANTSTNVGQTGGAHDTSGAGIVLDNNLSAIPFNNLTVQSTSNITPTVQNNLGVSTTQNLSAQTTSNLTPQTTQNLSASNSQNLSANLSGGVSNRTLSLAQIPSHTHPGGGGLLQSNVSQFSAGGNESSNTQFTSRAPTGNRGGNQAHSHGHNFSGNINGNASSNVSGNVNANLSGNLVTNVSGAIAHNLTGSLDVQTTGDIATNTSGEVSANITGDVTLNNVSLYEPHLVTIYIIKH